MIQRINVDHLVDGAYMRFCKMIIKTPSFKSKWIENVAAYVKDEFSKAQNNLNGVEYIEIVEIDELCTYIKKDQKMAENIPLYGLLLIDGRTKLLILK